MGLGRVGRNLLRILYDDADLEIVAISDPAPHDALEYLIRFDTTLGPFPELVRLAEGDLYIRGRRIAMLSASEAIDVPWADHGVETVIAATGRHRTRAELEGHLSQGARRVILCSPPVDPPDITVIAGINDQLLSTEHSIVSNASCTAHCAAPLLAILDDAFGVERAFLTSVHAYGAQQRLADVPAEDPRRGRAAAENIIPQETNAAAVIVELLPQLAGRLSAKAMNVPVSNGSVVDLVCWHREAVTETAINEVVRTAAAADRWKRTLCYEDDPLVSHDVIRAPYSSYSSIFDSLSTMALGERLSKTLSWYDNSWAYALRAVELVRRFRNLDAEAQP